MMASKQQGELRISETALYNELDEAFGKAVTRSPTNLHELPLADRGLLTLKVAVAKVIEEHAREGLPLYLWRDGKVVAVPAEELQECDKSR